MSPAAAAGYSGKPVWQKLGLTAAARVLIKHAPSDYATLTGFPADLLNEVDADAAFDFAHVFATSAAQLAQDIHALAAALPARGMLWASWPKKTSRVATDISEDNVRAIALPLGLVDVNVCAIDTVWSRLKLVWRLEHRAGK